MSQLKGNQDVKKDSGPPNVLQMKGRLKTAFELEENDAIDGR